MNKKTLRMATAEDAAALLAIYAPYVEDTSVSFEYTVPSIEEFAQRIKDTLQKHPFILCEVCGVPVGYAYAAPFRTRAAYEWCVETSIYVSPSAHGAGVGRTLYEALLKVLALQGVRTAYACITHPNIPSEKFHASMGFSPIGVFKKVGYKQGVWHDLSWFEKQLKPFDNAPLPLTPVGELEEKNLKEIFAGE